MIGDQRNTEGPSAEARGLLASCVVVIALGLLLQTIMAPKVDGDGWGFFELAGFVAAACLVVWRMGRTFLRHWMS